MILGSPVFLVLVAFFSVIFVHELGHYLMGRFCKIGASTFSIGFGPKLISYTDQNHTEWKVCLIPLGGFVKFLTVDDIPSPDHELNSKRKMMMKMALPLEQRSFESSSLLARTLTVLAGPLANFLMAIVIFTYVGLVTGTMSNEPIIGNVVKLPAEQVSLMTEDRVLSIQGKKIDKFSEVYEFATIMDPSSTLDFQILRDGKILNLTVPYLFQPIVFHVEMFSPAMSAGIEVGDVFIKVDTKSVTSFDDIKAVINTSGANEIPITIWRNGKIISTTITPEMRPTETQNGDLVEHMRIGVRGGPLVSPKMLTPNIVEAGYMGFQMTFYVIKTSLIGLARIIDKTLSSKHISGPVGVAKALSYSASEGYIPFLSLLAAISAGIGLINLFPIPILDGGHLVMFIYELIFKSPPPASMTRILMLIGFIILFALMVFATFNDIVR
ncbi:MAG: RIP metalloprotease RseP [Paracoccaceae bacterium]|nr:RIP metalloprotease RseP [Paracoccaceae bacterium]